MCLADGDKERNVDELITGMNLSSSKQWIVLHSPAGRPGACRVRPLADTHEEHQIFWMGDVDGLSLSRWPHPS